MENQLGYNLKIFEHYIKNIPSVKEMLKLGMKKIGEFDHPLLDMERPLKRRHLYRITARDMDL